MMFQTKEIRWFFKEEKKPIKDWFDNLSIDTLTTREDVYLNLKKNDVGVKLRDGKIEIKHRIGTRAKGCLNDNVWGCFEEYIKWSFSVIEDDALYSLIKDRHANWTTVRKQRRALKLKEGDGKLDILPITQKVSSGCQVEYTEIYLEEKQWYTFGLEWFGEKHVGLEPDFISKILGDAKLLSRHSMGYAAFLSK